MSIDSSARIDPKAEIDSDVTIGPWTIIGPNVQIGSGTVIDSHVMIRATQRLARTIEFSSLVLSVKTPQIRNFMAKKPGLRLAITMSCAKGLTCIAAPSPAAG